MLTAFGSAWYHAAPSDATLVWDRLPIAAAFAGLVAATIADRQRAWARPLTVGLGSVAVATVLLWAVTGNLLPYVMMQLVFVAVALLTTALVRSRWTHARAVYLAAATYGLAVVCERYDRPFAEVLNGIVSGHTLKHLLAATALLLIFMMIARRQPLAG